MNGHKTEPTGRLPTELIGAGQLFAYLGLMKHILSRPARLVVSLVFGLGLMFLSGASHAAERDKVEAFLEVTGFDVALESIKFSAEIAPDMLNMDTSEFGVSWTAMAESVFDVGMMHDMAVDILELTLTEDLLAHAAGFYATDLGQRLVEIENAAHLDPDDAAKQEDGAKLVAQMVRDGAPRLESLKRLNQAVDSSGTAVRAMQEVQVRFLLAASAAGVIELRMDADELAAMFKAQEGEMRLAVAKSALAGAANTYRAFTDDEVEIYATALEHPDMKSVYELMNAVQYEITANRFEVLAERMADLHPAQDI